MVHSDESAASRFDRGRSEIADNHADAVLIPCDAGRFRRKVETHNFVAPPFHQTEKEAAAAADVENGADCTNSFGSEADMILEYQPPVEFLQRAARKPIVLGVETRHLFGCRSWRQSHQSATLTLHQRICAWGDAEKAVVASEN